MTLKLFFALASLILSSRAISRFPKRPKIEPYPLDSWKPLPCSPERDPSKVCFVHSTSGYGDDASELLDALQRCNNGGTVVMDKVYTIASPLNLTFLNAVDVVISGKVSFSANISYWVENEFHLSYRNQSAMWIWGGRDVNFYGGGVINGNGQVWWDGKAKNSSLARPLMFVVQGLHGGSITDLTMLNPPDFFNFISGSSNILVSNLNMSAISDDNNPPANTDGWDLYQSDNIVIQNSIINNGDDCLALKANSTNVVVQGLQCNGSHGISIGSLGEELGEIDIVENVYIYNNSLSNSTEGAAIRLKVVPNINPRNPNNDDGGGSGYIRNVTYDTFQAIDVPYAIAIDQCYDYDNETYCNQYPSKVAIEDVVIKNVWGKTRTEYGQHVGYLICNNLENCKNIRAKNIAVQPADGKEAEWICAGVNKSLLDINCINYTDPYTPVNS